MPNRSFKEYIVYRVKIYLVLCQHFLLHPNTGKCFQREEERKVLLKIQMCI